jgi:hypothetical protein
MNADIYGVKSYRWSFVFIGYSVLMCPFLMIGFVAGAVHSALCAGYGHGRAFIRRLADRA